MSDLFLDTKYIHKISHKLQRFHKTAKDKYSFRCPICGDSDKDAGKTRGNFQIFKGQLFFGCFNGCNSLPFPAFLKRIDPEEYDEYIVESFGHQKKSLSEDINISDSKPTFTSSVKSDSFFDTLTMISDLPDDHPARIYVINRGIKQLDRLYYTPKFKTFCNTVKPNTFNNIKFDTPRLIIPFMDEDSKPFAFQGRSFDPNSKTKYITIKLDEEMPKIYGLDKVDNTKPILLLEGPINTLFLNNAVAATGSNLESYADLLNDPILVYDNDSRNKNLVKLVERSIQNGRKVLIWDNKFKPTEDINDIYNNYNMSSTELTQYIISNAFSGLMAELKFTEWKKI